MDFATVVRRKRRPKLNQAVSTENLTSNQQRNQITAAKINGSAKSKSCTNLKMIEKPRERQRMAGDHSRRCICRWVMTFARLTTKEQLLIDYGTMGCSVCRLFFESKSRYSEHFKDHGKEFTMWLKPTDRRIARNTLRPTIKYLPRYSRLMVRLENDSQAVMILRSIQLVRGDRRIETVHEGALRMTPGYSFDMVHTVDECIPNHKYTIILSATLIDLPVEIVEQYHVQMLKSTKITGTPLKINILEYHHIPDYLVTVYKNQFEHTNHYNRLALSCLNNIRNYRKQGLTPTNYIEHLRLLNMIEDYDLQTIFATYTIPSVSLEACGETRRRYIISLNQFQVAPTLLEEDGYVRITVTRSTNARGSTFEYINGFIDTVDEHGIVITMQSIINVRFPCKAEFPLNRTQYKLEYNALGLISKIDLIQVLFPQSLPSKKRPVRQNEFKWIQPTISGNKEQMTAIRNIVNMTSFPAPYILFGPPGTGKTSTIVEAVLQIWKHQPKAHVLVAASSNFACDELTKRLMAFVPEYDIFRFYSRSCERKIEMLDIDILEISNLATGVYEIPSYDHVYRSRIVVSTVTNCGRLAQARLVSGFFSYIFIDECGSAKEVSALVPIAGIGTDGSQITSSIILAGDPKQLGPVVRTEYLKMTVHNTSMLERLMSQGIYKRNPKTGLYNPLVISKLLDNYRSHYALIDHSNQWFYDGELRAQALPERTDWAINWNCLPNMAFPIIFHSVVGVTRMDNRSCSSYNREEAQRVMFYVQKMLTDGINNRQIREEDIGIVSPYSKQVSYLKQGCLNYGFDNIEVGSVEQYQGREKQIIIISTVRSDRHNVGFLSNCKRLNVAITRARALMIIVGNPCTLQKDPHWYRLLRYISLNQGFRGIDFVLQKPEIDFSDNPFAFALEESDFC